MAAPLAKTTLFDAVKEAARRYYTREEYKAVAYFGAFLMSVIDMSVALRNNLSWRSTITAGCTGGVEGAAYSIVLYTVAPALLPAIPVAMAVSRSPVTFTERLPRLAHLVKQDE